jgi:hypothetical protein
MAPLSPATRRRLAGPRKRTTISLPAVLVEEAVRELGYPNLTAAIVGTLDDALRTKRIEEFIHSEAGPSPAGGDELRRSRFPEADAASTSFG